MAENNLATIQKPIRVFRALTKNQYNYYIQMVTGDSQAMADAAIRKMTDTGTIRCIGNIVSSGSTQFDKKTCAAFWGYLALFKTADTNFFAAEFPAQIGFAGEKDIYRIVVCDDKYHDKEMIALREQRKDDVKLVIVGINIHLNDISEKILPDVPFTYIYMGIRDIMSDIPQMAVEAQEADA